MNLIKKFRYKIKSKKEGLLTGWHVLEEDRKSYFRWTKKKAKFFINEKVDKLVLEIASNKNSINGSFIINGKKTKFGLRKNSNKVVSFDLNNKKINGEIIVNDLFKSPDKRLLGVKVKKIVYQSNSKMKEVDIRKTRGKRVVVATSKVPFEKGGNEYLAETIVKKLNERGYDACLFYTPQNRHYKFKELIKGYLSNYLIDLKEYNGKKIDLVISLKYPSFAIRHPNHVCWFNHRQREYYDLWNDWIIHEKECGRGFKRKIEKKLIHAIDSRFLKNNVKRLYAQSKNIQKRLDKWGGIKSEVLYAPPVKESNLHCSSYDNYIFTISRLSEIKRIELLINAFKYVVNKNVKCLIAGDGEEREKLEKIIKKNNLEQKVKLLGFISDEKAVKYLANCRAVFFGPYQEDYGLVTIEAMKSKKPVITCTDSGGPTEFVTNNETGFIVKPNPKSIAKSIDKLNKNKAEKMGKKAYEKVKEINWDNTIKKLVEI